jgi:hypothetical protein
LLHPLGVSVSRVPDLTLEARINFNSGPKLRDRCAQLFSLVPENVLSGTELAVTFFPPSTHEVLLEILRSTEYNLRQAPPTQGGQSNMIEGQFDRRTFAAMNVALDRVCEKDPRGEQHKVRKRVAQAIIRCAEGGETTLAALTEAGERELTRLSGKPPSHCGSRNMPVRTLDPSPDAAGS